MIRYHITRSELEEAINTEKPDWLEKARRKTASVRQAGEFNEPDKDNSWGEIKAVYMRLQKEKCIYCERALASEQYGKIEHDVEHYRPKNPVKAWPAKKMKRIYDFPTGNASAKGYYLLAYNQLNYATACKTCNTPLKSNYFPIAGSRIVNSDDLERLKNEKPYLIYPVSDLDENPEDLITFAGILPVPKVRRGHRYRRARVTIDFFALDTRDELLRSRAEIIQNILLAYLTLNNQNAPDEDRGIAQSIIKRALSPDFQHSNCARSFHNLCQQDIQRARDYVKQARQILVTE